MLITGRIQCEVLATLSLKFKGFYDNNQKSEMIGQWRNYSCKLWKSCDIAGPNNLRKNLFTKIVQ